MLWMLVTENKLKPMPRFELLVSQIIICGKHFKHFFFYVSNEKSLVLVPRILGNNRWNIDKKILPVRSQTIEKQEANIKIA